MTYAAIVVGGSAGSLDVLKQLLPALPATLPMPLLLVEHLHTSDNGAFASHMGRLTTLRVVEPCDKMRICAGTLYCAPANYHMLVERDRSIALSVDARVNWSRPSIDVLFESAADVWGRALLAILLSGASVDGTRGLRAIKAAGGRTLAQAPDGSASSVMPQAAIAAGAVDDIVQPADLAPRVLELVHRGGA